MQLENEKTLRRTIDTEEYYSAREDAKKQLAFFYIMESKGYLFTFENLLDYLEDYLVRDIRAAEEYLITAAEIDEDRFGRGVSSLGVTIAPQYKAKLGDLSGEILAKAIAKKEDFRSSEQTRYTGCPEKGEAPEVFNREHIGRYLSDWVGGKQEARKFVVQAARDYPEIITRSVSALASVDDFKKVIKLLADLPQQTKALRSIVFKAGQGLMYHAKGPFETAEAIGILLQCGIFKDVLEDTSVKDYRTVILETNVLGYMSSENNFVAVVNLFGPQYYNKIASGLFKALFVFSARESIENGFNLVFKNLNQLGKMATSATEARAFIPKEGAQPQDITIDYYIASMKNSVTDLVYLATQKNGEMFKTLFLEEIDNVKRHDSNGKIYRERKPLYRNLLSALSKVNFRYYDQLTASANELAVMNQEPNIAEQSSTLLTYMPGLAFVPTSFSKLFPTFSFLSSSKLDDQQGKEMRSGVHPAPGGES